jgi:transcriptional regulator with XRE-family HTH domain
VIDPVKISAAITEKMAIKKLSQVEVARLTGLSQSQISRFRAGKFKRDSRNLKQLCQKLGVTIATPASDGQQVLHVVQKLLRVEPRKTDAIRRLMDALHELITD